MQDSCTVCSRARFVWIRVAATRSASVHCRRTTRHAPVRRGSLAQAFLLRSRKAALNSCAPARPLSTMDCRWLTHATFERRFRMAFASSCNVIATWVISHSVTWHALHPAESTWNGSTGPSQSSTAHDMGRKQSQQERDKRKLASNLKQQNRSRGRDHRRAGRLSLVRGTQDRELQHTRRF